MGLPVEVDLLVPEDPPVLQGSPDLLDPLDHQECLDLLVPLDRRDLLVLVDALDQLDLLDHLVFLALQERQARLVPVSWVQSGHRAGTGKWELQDPLELLAPRDLQVQ
jgi:hypothetical protein